MNWRKSYSSLFYSPRFLCRPKAFCLTCWSRYEERSDVPRLQQVEQKAVGRQRNLRLIVLKIVVMIDNQSFEPLDHSRPQL
jgi:hypothetical protein